MRIVTSPIVIASIIWLTGCAAPLSKDAARVRTISPVVAQDCRLAGNVNTFGAVIVGGLTFALREAREEVADLGGNAMVIINQYVDHNGHGEINAEAYLCEGQSFRSVANDNDGVIGVQLVMESGYAKVDKVIGGGPADKSGLINRNDRIASIGQGTNGEMVSVDGLTLGEVIGSISGPVGSTVRLEILPASNRSNDTRTRVVELRRGVIE